MKLLGLITKVKQKQNKNLIGQLVILKDKICVDLEENLCYSETEDTQDESNRTFLQSSIPLKHGISNIKIIGIY